MSDVFYHLARWVLWIRGFRSRTLGTSVGAVHALVAEGWGDGPPIVVQHGIGSAAVHFGGVLPGLRAVSRRVIAVDLPGHGFSDVPAQPLKHALLPGLVEALDALVDEPVLFVGNSLGGAAAVRYAHARPERVAGLLLVSPGPMDMPDDELPGFLDRFRVDDLAAATRFVDRIHASPPPYRRLIAPVVRATFGQPHLRAMVDGVARPDLIDASELRGLRVPVRVMWGRREGLLPEGHLRFLRDHLPEHAELIEPDWGHCPHLDAPDALGDAIATYARSGAPELAAAAG